MAGYLDEDARRPCFHGVIITDLGRYPTDLSANHDGDSTNPRVAHRRGDSRWDQLDSTGGKKYRQGMNSSRYFTPAAVPERVAAALDRFAGDRLFAALRHVPEHLTTSIARIHAWLIADEGTELAI